MLGKHSRDPLVIGNCFAEGDRSGTFTRVGVEEIGIFVALAGALGIPVRDGVDEGAHAEMIAHKAK
ncbi:MAG: hypothetical protein HY257_08980 [Chloroflexi bacterium]|nr:hypothetical protein [Chloroflexota bacterium]